jgi:hypothetical protein
MHESFKEGFEKTAGKGQAIRSVLRRKAGPKFVNVSQRAPAPQAYPAQWDNVPKQKYLNDLAKEQAEAQAIQAQERASKDYGHLPGIAAGVGGLALGYSLAN